MTFDESLSKAEEIIRRLEQSEALSLTEYKKAAAEATTLLKNCRAELIRMEQELAE
ncbi:MAG: exodeoxyribonuclease VII small subunit [Paludibacteraceae bacterium]|nr:exodeoxyribonuclease VII small subunit [Paludibacteraceae bacterium]